MSNSREWDLSCKVYIGNLARGTSKYDLEDVFRKFGPMKNVWVARSPPGFAFVQYEDPRDAEDAVSSFKEPQPKTISILWEKISFLWQQVSIAIPSNKESVSLMRNKDKIFKLQEWDLSCKVYIGNLGNNASEYEIENNFSKYGPIKNVWVARNPPGFAFVEYEDPRDAEDAVRALDGTRMCGARIRVEMSHGRKRGSGGAPRRRSPPPLPPRDRRFRSRLDSLLI
ncbi:unnamed protein product [Darwinula stevensoni]|uniref:RRM domain-containing protein n=1 Tax=Darwinula stevensoni TaxID=69355 RepID=A0A7R9A3T1_9CRUS|nr:unnamed protein product [Darwinula stevensoni]CAG0882793.1 unnamed protein product [Darwinula stevensoni]